MMGGCRWNPLFCREHEPTKFEVKLPLLTEEEKENLDLNWKSYIDQYLEMYLKNKDLAISQYLAKKQQEEIETLKMLLSEIFNLTLAIDSAIMNRKYARANKFNIMIRNRTREFKRSDKYGSN